MIDKIKDALIRGVLHALGYMCLLILFVNVARLYGK